MEQDISYPSGGNEAREVGVNLADGGGSPEVPGVEPVPTVTPEADTDDLQTGAPERPAQDSNRIYVASLLDYNNGVLHGVWIDAEQEADAITAEARAMLARSPTAAATGEVAEEWAIHDYDGDAFSRLPIRETEWLSDVARIAQLVSDHGEPFIVLAQDAGLDDLDFLEAAVQDSFVGHWPSVEAYAEEMFDEMGGRAYVEAAPEYIRPFLRFDANGLAQQMETELTILGGRDGVYIFNPNS